MKSTNGQFKQPTDRSQDETYESLLRTEVRNRETTREGLETLCRYVGRLPKTFDPPLDSLSLKVFRELPDQIDLCISAINSRDSYFFTHEGVDAYQRMPLVWIFGEEGTGKRELIMAIKERLLYRKRIVWVDCRKFTSGEEACREMYGTGQSDGLEMTGGKFLEAEMGIIVFFFPERMPVKLQQRLAYWHNFRTVPVEAGEVESVDAVCVFVSTLSPDSLVQEGKIIKELFPGNALQIHVPPLRAARYQISAYLWEYLLETGYTYRKVLFDKIEIEEDAERLLQQFHWPDNKNGLKAFVEYLIFNDILKSPDDRINAAQVKQALSRLYGDTADKARERVMLLSKELAKISRESYVSPTDIVKQVLIEIFGEDSANREPERSFLEDILYNLWNAPRRDPAKLGRGVTESVTSDPVQMEGRRALSEYSHDELKQMWHGYPDKHGSLRAMAKALGVDHSNLSKELKKRGIRQTRLRKSTNTDKS